MFLRVNSANFSNKILENGSLFVLTSINLDGGDEGHGRLESVCLDSCLVVKLGPLRSCGTVIQSLKVDPAIK